MRLTAQRVRSSLGDVGINRYVWRHPSGPMLEDLDAADNSAELVDASYEVVPGDNAVLSYLDVYAPDGTRAGDVADWLAEVAQGPEPAGFPWVVRDGTLALRFGLTFGLMATWRDELMHLAGSAVLLASRVPGHREAS